MLTERIYKTIFNGIPLTLFRKMKWKIVTTVTVWSIVNKEGQIIEKKEEKKTK